MHTLRHTHINHYLQWGAQTFSFIVHSLLLPCAAQQASASPFGARPAPNSGTGDGKHPTHTRVESRLGTRTTRPDTVLAALPMMSGRQGS